MLQFKIKGLINQLKTVFAHYALIKEVKDSGVHSELPSEYESLRGRKIGKIARPYLLF